MKKKIICIFVLTLLITTILPSTVIAGDETDPEIIDDVGISIIPSVIGTEQSSPVGFGPWKVYGLFPSVSDDGITCFLIGPFLGWTTLSLTRFNGHIGIIFLSGEYQWFENGPPALP